MSNGISKVMEDAIAAVKAVAMEKLAVMEGFKQAQKDFKAAHAAYMSLTGERLTPGTGQGRKPGSTNKPKNEHPNGKGTVRGANQKAHLQFLLQHPASTVAQLEKGTTTHSTSASLTRCVDQGYMSRGKDSEGRHTYSITSKGKTRLVELEKLLSS